MLRLLTTRRWLAWLTVAAVAAVACLLLGRWQWHRWESRGAAQQSIERNFSATPVPFDQVVTGTSDSVTRAESWRRVELRGTYDSGQQTLVRNRPLRGTYGYEVLVPLRLSEGRSVVVNRGWVPNGPSAGTPPPVAEAPGGVVTVLGWARPAEPDLERSPIPGQVSSINPTLLQRAGGAPLYTRAYVRMQSETPAPAQRPSQLERPDLGMAAGINLSYAFQWWLAMVAFPVLVVLAARRELPGYTPRQKKRTVRIWDEEDG